MKLPVYEFLGYRTRQIAYMIDGEEYPREMKISVPQSYFDEEKNLYQFLIVMDGNDMKDGKNVCHFVFQAFFSLNDLKWCDDLKKNDISLDNMLFPVVFPFIRQKVMNIMEDSGYSPVLPVLDLRGADLKKGVVIEL